MKKLVAKLKQYSPRVQHKPQVLQDKVWSPTPQKSHNGRGFWQSVTDIELGSNSMFSDRRRYAVIIGLAAMGLMACNSQSPPAAAAPSRPEKKAAAPPQPVEVITASTQLLPRTLLANATLSSTESIAIAADVSGRVDRLAFTEGSAVAKGALLFSLDNRVQNAELERVSATLALSKQQAARATELANKGMIASAEKDEVLGKLAVLQAEIQLARTQLAKTQVFAPAAGVLGLKTAAVGDYLSAGTPVVRLEVMHPISAEFSLPETSLPLLRVGQSVEVTVDTYPSETFSGQVHAIAPSLSVDNRSVKIKARIPNSALRLKPGMFAQLQLVTQAAEQALMLPEAAVIQQGEEAYCYVVIKDHAERRQLRLGLRKPGWVEVLDGVAVGESVVVNGNAKLQPKSAVSIVGNSKPKS